VTSAVNLTGESLAIAERLLADVGRLLAESHVPYWLEGGTLLGIVREQRLLPWDNDLDISMKAEALPQLLSALRRLPRTRYFVRIKRVKEDNARFRQRTVRLIKIYNARWFGLRRGEVCLDVFVKYAQGDETYWMVGRKVKSVPSRFYEVFDSIEFKGQRYTIPARTDEYLTYRYGDWRTPVQEWNTYRDDRALVREQSPAA
jgi:phosphorylcholine metabolism protein LicD